VPGKIMERFILSVLTGHVKDNQGIRPSQHGLMKGRSRFTSMISSVDEGKAVDAISTWTLVKPLILSPTAFC